MSSQRDSFITKDHAIIVIQEMIKSANLDLEAENLNDSETKELDDFINPDSDFNQYSIPKFLGLLLIEDESLRKIWDTLGSLSISSRKLLFYSAAGHEPKLIVESLGLKGQIEYWEGLKEAESSFEQMSGMAIDQKSIHILEIKLVEILNRFLELSDQIDLRNSKSKNKISILSIPGIVLIVLILSYIFLWNLVFPPSGEEIYLERIDMISEGIDADLDSIAWFMHLQDALSVDDFEVAIEVLEDEIQISNELPADVKSLYAALLFKVGRFAEGREFIKEVKYDSYDLFQTYFKGLIWKIRFLK